MSLEYFIIPSGNLNGKFKNYSNSQHSQTLTYDQFLKEATRPGSGVTTAEMKSAFETTLYIVKKYLEEGYRVETPLATFRSTVRGGFDGFDDVFKRPRNSVSIKAEPNIRLKKAADNITPRKVHGPNRIPSPRSYYDGSSDSEDSIITPRGFAHIKGKLLKITEGEEDQGIFFINKKNKKEVVQVPFEKIRVNKPKELIFSNPELPPGIYLLEVRNTPHRVKKTRTGRFQGELEVAE